MKNAKLTADKQTVGARVLNAELIDNEKAAEQSAVFCLPFSLVCHPEILFRRVPLILSSRNRKVKTETQIFPEGSPAPNRLQIQTFERGISVGQTPTLQLSLPKSKPKEAPRGRSLRRWYSLRIALAISR